MIVLYSVMMSVLVQQNIMPLYVMIFIQITSRRIQTPCGWEAKTKYVLSYILVLVWFDAEHDQNIVLAYIPCVYYETFNWCWATLCK